MTGMNESVADSLARALRDDAAAAAPRVNQEFRSRLIRLADRLLDPRVQAAVGAEDVAQSVLKSFFLRQLNDPHPVGSRDELWQLLAKIARRKCVRAARREFSQKRGGGRRVVADDAEHTADWEPSDPTALAPEAVALMNDLHNKLLDHLDELHRPVCELRLDGYEVTEIATKLGVSARTIERRLSRVRDRLSGLDTED